MKYLIVLLFSTALLAISATGQASEDKDSKDAQRQQLLSASQSSLQQLYAAEPAARAEVESSTGYAVFSSNGPGTLHYNSDGKDLYMKMVSAGSGMGMGGEAFKIVLIFQDAKALDNFKDVGWDVSGQASSADDSPTTGVGVSGASSVLPGTTVYKLTANGLQDNPSLKGVKFIMEEKLN
jgi:lipid-binding SYLF domain-containing protein